MEEDERVREEEEKGQESKSQVEMNREARLVNRQEAGFT